MTLCTPVPHKQLPRTYTDPAGGLIDSASGMYVGIPPTGARIPRQARPPTAVISELNSLMRAENSEVR